MSKACPIRLSRFWRKGARVETKTLPSKHKMLFEEVGTRESSVSTRRFHGSVLEIQKGILFVLQPVIN